jgi:hypothetical protein
MSNANGPSGLDPDETRRALTEDELDAVAGSTIVMVNGGGNTPNGNAIISDGRLRVIANGRI